MCILPPWVLAPRPRWPGEPSRGSWGCCKCWWRTLSSKQILHGSCHKCYFKTIKDGWYPPCLLRKFLGSWILILQLDGNTQRTARWPPSAGSPLGSRLASCLSTMVNVGRAWNEGPHKSSQSRRRPLRTRTLSWLKADTTAFTFKTLLNELRMQLSKGT